MPTIQEWFKAAENNDAQFLRMHHTIFRTATTSDGMTALMIGACCGHMTVVQELCSQENGCTTASGKAAIHFGLDSDNWGIVSLMLPYEASLRNAAGDTLLHWAVRVRAKTCITKLLAQYDMAVNNDGLTAVQLAQSLGYMDLLPLLCASPIASQAAPPPTSIPVTAPAVLASPAVPVIPAPLPRPGNIPASPVIQPSTVTHFPMSMSSILPGDTTSRIALGASTTTQCDKCTKLMQQNKELSTELDRLKEHNASLLAQYQTAMEAMTSTQSANASFMSQIAEGQTAISRLEAELEKQKALVKNSSTESAHLMLQMSTSSSQVTILQNELQSKDEEIKMLKAKVTELEENTTEIIRMTETAINARATITANQLATQLEERNNLQSKVSNLEAENTDLMAKLAASQSAVDSLIQSQTAAQEQNNNLLKTITDLNTRMAQFSNDNAVSSKRIAELEEQIGSKTSEVSDLRKQLTMVQSGILESTAEGAQMSSSVKLSSRSQGYGAPGHQISLLNSGDFTLRDRGSIMGTSPTNSSGNVAAVTSLNTSQLIPPLQMTSSSIYDKKVPQRSEVSTTSSTYVEDRWGERNVEQENEGLSTKSTTFRDRDGNTALILAAMAGDLSTVVSLAPYQEKVTNTTGETALMKAAENGHLDVVHALLEKQVGKATYSGKTALMSAALNGHLNICKLLIPYEAGMARKDGWTALMSAARNNHLEIVRLLIEQEARRQTKDGTTALIKAIEHGNLEVVKTLAPIELDLTLKGGATALMKCKRTTYPEMYDYLKSLQD